MIHAGDVPQKMAAIRQRDVLFLTLATLIALLVRLATLVQVPIFYDESVYLRRALVFPQLLESTLIDGKLLQELALALLANMPGDLLLWGRGISLSCGLAIVVALYCLGSVLHKPVAGIIAAFLYAIAPLAGLHDGLALPDSLLTLVGCGVLATSLRLAYVEHPNRWDAALAGGMVALAGLVKLSGLFLICTPICAVVMLTNGQDRQDRLKLLPMVWIATLSLPALLAPFHYGGAERGKLGSDWVASRLENIPLLIDWLSRYIPVVLLTLPLAALVLRRNAPVRSAIAWLFVSGIGLIGTFLVVGSAVYPRYLLPAWPPLFLASGLAVCELWEVSGHWRRVVRWSAILIVGGSLVWGLYFAALIALQPITAPLAAVDRRQYLETWTAGYPKNELLYRLQQEARKRGIITLAIDTEPRLIGNLALVYLRNHPAIEFVRVDFLQPTVDSELRQYAKLQPTYLLVDQQQLDGYQIGSRFADARMVVSVKNPYSEMRFYIYEIMPTQTH